MTTKTKHTLTTLLTTILATLILTTTITTASANRISASSKSIRVTWTSLNLSNTVNANRVLCGVTLEGSLHSATIVKSAGSLIGFITRATIRNPCTNGNVTINQASLPWHIRYRSFTGALPNFSGIVAGLIGVRFTIREPGGTTCNGTTEVNRPAVGTVNINGEHFASSLTPDPTTRIQLEGGFLESCAFGEGAYEGTSNKPTVAGAATLITVTLI